MHSAETRMREIAETNEAVSPAKIAKKKEEEEPTG